VNLREWALSQGIHPQTAYRWYRQGKLPVPAQKMGKLILVGDLEATTQASPGRAAVSARVSSATRGPIWTARWPGWWRGRPSTATKWAR
jgi:putative resolvase